VSPGMGLFSTMDTTIMTKPPIMTTRATTVCAITSDNSPYLPITKFACLLTARSAHFGRARTTGRRCRGQRRRERVVTRYPRDPRRREGVDVGLGQQREVPAAGQQSHRARSRHPDQQRLGHRGGAGKVGGRISGALIDGGVITGGVITGGVMPPIPPSPVPVSPVPVPVSPV